MILYENNPKIQINSEFVLKKIAKAQPGDHIVILADRESYSNARAFADVAKNMGCPVFICDVDMYGGNEGYANIPVMRTLRNAILSADITFMTTPQMKTGFQTYLGSQKEGDSSLTGKEKRFTFEIGGLMEWELDEERIFADRNRANVLFEKLKYAKKIHITSKRGTDLTCVFRGEGGQLPDGMYPVNGIIPFYSEVAIVPALGTVTGVAVIDGASERAYGQRGFPIRPNIPGYREIYMAPLVLTFENSDLVSYTGPKAQGERLDKLMQDVSPKPDICDEIGIVTATSIENDQYGWCVDGSHHTRCVHVALGNNRNRKEIIHSTEHIDFDIHEPTIEVDGVTICVDGEYDDAAIESLYSETNA